jgi:hypothetical protein
MRTKLLLSTAALSLVLGTAGYGLAQTRDSDDAKMKREVQKLEQNKKPTAASEQGKATTSGQASSSDTKSNATQNKPESTTTAGDNKKDSNNAASKPSTDSSKPASAQSDQSTKSPSTASGSSKSQPSTASDTSKSQPSTASETSKSQPSTASDTSKSQPSTASDTSKSQPSAASNNQTTQPTTAQQPAQTQNAAAPSAQQNTRVSASLQAGQKTQLNQAFAKVSVKPVANVNFSVSVGTAVPTSVTLHPVPETVVSIIPQYRGYDFFVVRDEYVIVEPRTHKIVDVIEHSGGGRAASTTTTTKSKVNLSQKDRAYIREHATTRRTTTTGSASRGETRIKVGEDAPEATEIESFPTEVYREVPAVRTYRYIHSGDDIYLVEPGSRRVIESIGED